MADDWARRRVVLGRDNIMWAERRRLIGRRVRLIESTDEWTHLDPGSLGIVTFVDDLGTVHVSWDSGSRLGLIPGEDRWELLPIEDARMGSAPDPPDAPPNPGTPSKRSQP